MLGSVGSHVGNALGSAAGAGLAALGGGLLAKITGRGDYRVEKNTLLRGDVGPPTFSKEGDGIVISHREFIADVSSIGAPFSLQSYPINPGMYQTFPYLANLATSFEQYEMLGMVFEFKTTSATAVSSTNTALGVVIGATNYDPLDPNFVNKTQMEAYEFATSSVPSQSFIHPIECAPSQTPLRAQFIRSGPIPTGGDIRMYDIGTFQIATVGQQAASVIGELWVSYHVRLLKPRLPGPMGSQIAVMNGVSNTLSGPGQPSFAAGPGAGSTISFTAVAGASNIITFTAFGRFVFNGFTETDGVANTYSGAPWNFGGAAVALPATFLVAGGGSISYCFRQVVDCNGPCTLSCSIISVTGGNTYRQRFTMTQTTSTSNFRAARSRRRMEEFYDPDSDFQVAAEQKTSPGENGDTGDCAVEKDIYIVGDTEPDGGWSPPTRTAAALIAARKRTCPTN